MTNVVGIKPVERGYNAQVVEALEEMLAEAKAGRILSMMVVSEMTEGLFDARWSGTDDLYKLSGMAARMQHNIQRRIDDGILPA